MANTKIVYRYDNDGYYTGPEIAFESPLEPEVVLCDREERRPGTGAPGPETTPTTP